MPEISSTDRYDPDRDSFKFCSYCDMAVAQTTGSKTIGLCRRHEAIWHEDMKSGFKQNRLKDLIDQAQTKQTT